MPAARRLAGVRSASILLNVCSRASWTRSSVSARSRAHFGRRPLAQRWSGFRCRANRRSIGVLVSGSGSADQLERRVEIVDSIVRHGCLMPSALRDINTVVLSASGEF